MFFNPYSFKSTNHYVFQSVLPLLALQWQLKEVKIFICRVNFRIADNGEFRNNSEKEKNRIYLKGNLSLGSGDSK